MKFTIEEYDIEKEAVKKSREKLEHSLGKFSYKWLMKHYNVVFNNDITINGRMTRTMGRVTIGVNGVEKVEIAEELLLDYRLTGDSSVLIGVLKHELIHYALYKTGKPFDDSDDYFKKECEKHGAPLSIGELAGAVHVYECSQGHKLEGKRKINENNYVCSCESKLKYKGRKVKLR